MNALGQEFDCIALRPVLLVTVLAVGILLMSLVVAWLATGPASTIAPPLRAERIGAVQPTSIPASASARSQARARTRLHTYGWTDSAHRRLRIPIERAIELRARGRLPEGSP